VRRNTPRRRRIELSLKQVALRRSKDHPRRIALLRLGRSRIFKSEPGPIPPWVIFTAAQPLTCLSESSIPPPVRCISTHSRANPRLPVADAQIAVNPNRATRNRQNEPLSPVHAARLALRTLHLNISRTSSLVASARISLIPLDPDLSAHLQHATLLPQVHVSMFLDRHGCQPEQKE